MAEESFLIKDPVHGSIELRGGKYLRPIIDSREFQRLRKIRQLGGASYVYPGATHTRFEHSIGVCYIASELLKSLKEKDSTFGGVYEDNEAGKKELDSDIKCVEIAALCHDLGHGPFSHLYDLSIDKTSQEEDYKYAAHEYRSVQIFQQICDNLKDSPIVDNNDEKLLIGRLITFSEDYKESLKEWKKKPGCDDAPNEIKERQILDGIPSCNPNMDYPSKKMFLFEIVANGFTGIDVDKMDYFLRDGHMTGLPSIFEWRRYIQTLKVLRNEEGIYHLCSRDKEERELYQLFHIRTQLYHQVYRHKTTIAVEHMIGEALKKANNTLFISRRNGRDNLKILEAWKDINSFLLLDDSVEDIIMLDMKLAPSQPSPDTSIARFELNGTTKEAKTIFENIRKRKLCKYIGDSSSDEQETKLKIEELEKKYDIGRNVIFSKKAKFSYGMGAQNPIEYHYFYKKGQDSAPFRGNKLQPSKMRLTEFEETKWKCYVKEEHGLTDEILAKIKQP